MSPTLYHYTCDHGREGLGDTGHVRVNPESIWGYAWFTDLEVPYREGLGLTSGILTCDRTAHRFRVTCADDIRPWVEVRREWLKQPLGWGVLLYLESCDAMPMHWWVSTTEVPVEYDPIESLGGATP